MNDYVPYMLCSDENSIIIMDHTSLMVNYKLEFYILLIINN